jgi:hypothetical protein
MGQPVALHSRSFDIQPTYKCTHCRRSMMYLPELRKHVCQGGKQLTADQVNQIIEGQSR